MNKEKLIYYSSLIFCILGGGVIFFIFMKYVFISLLPFLIAWAIAFAVRRPSHLLSKKIKVSERVIRAVLSILGAVLAVAVGCGLIWQLLSLLWRFLSDFAQSGLTDVLESLSSFRFGLFNKKWLPDELIEELGGAFRNAVNSMISELGAAVTKWISAVPKALFFLLISLIATIYFSIDLENINSKIKKLLPDKIFNALVRIKNSFLSVGVKYARSYLLIMFITFSLMIIGFSVLRIKYAPLIALVVALLDVLPVLGVGTVLVPWSIFSFISGNTATGIGLIVLLLVNEITRQIAEPKIIGKSLNVHPLLTLVLLYVGFSLFGFIGLILLPLAAVLINLVITKNNSSEVG